MHNSAALNGHDILNLYCMLNLDNVQTSASGQWQECHEDENDILEPFVDEVIVLLQDIFGGGSSDFTELLEGFTVQCSLVNSISSLISTFLDIGDLDISCKTDLFQFLMTFGVDACAYVDELDLRDNIKQSFLGKQLCVSSICCESCSDECSAQVTSAYD